MPLMIGTRLGPYGPPLRGGSEKAKGKRQKYRWR